MKRKKVSEIITRKIPELQLHNSVKTRGFWSSLASQNVPGWRWEAAAAPPSGCSTLPRRGLERRRHLLFPECPWQSLSELPPQEGPASCQQLPPPGSRGWQEVSPLTARRSKSRPELQCLHSSLKNWKTWVWVLFTITDFKRKSLLPSLSSFNKVQALFRLNWKTHYMILETLSWFFWQNTLKGLEKNSHILLYICKYVTLAGRCSDRLCDPWSPRMGRLRHCCSNKQV